MSFISSSVTTTTTTTTTSATATATATASTANITTDLSHEPQPLLSLSCSSLDSNELGNMWTALNKYKTYIENGQRLENMSWRLWHRQQQQQPDRIDNNIKQVITSLILSPATLVHDAYSHEVAQSTQKYYLPTIHHHASSTSLPRPLSFNVKQEQEEEEYYISDGDIYEDDDIYDDDIYEDDDIYDDSDIYNREDEDDVNYHFVRDFTKTQPRPATPRRSLLSDLLQRAPSLLSNSSCSFTSTATQNSIEHNESAPSINKNNTMNNNTIEWSESFHGW